MKKGQKSVRGGIEDFLCPFENFYLTCGPNESKQHMGIMAIDVRGSASGVREAYYAPATSKCLRTYPESGQVMWQTINKVRCSNKYVGIVTYMTVHDDTMNAYPGLVVPQGNQLGNMGTKGNATGVHCHIECSQSNDTTWFKNSYGNWSFNKEVDPENVFFMDNTKILNGVGKWKYLKDVPVNEYQLGNYKCLFNMNVRVGAGTDKGIKKVKDLSADGKKNATSTNENDNAVYKEGTVFTAKEIITNSDGSVWAKTPSGYVCIKDKENTYCKAV